MKNGDFPWFLGAVETPSHVFLEDLSAPLGAGYPAGARRNLSGFSWLTGTWNLESETCSKAHISYIDIVIFFRYIIDII
jgi:hypothetical protein